MREDASFFDVRDEDPFPVGMTDRIEVRDIAFEQVEFDGASCAFGDDDIELVAQLVEGVTSDGPEGFDLLVVLTCGDVLFRCAENDEL